MALNSSGPLSFGGSTAGQSINLELGVSATATASIDSAAFRGLAGVPSGAISLNNFYGKSSESYWIGLLNGGTDDQGYAIAVDSDSNVYVGGQSNLGGTGKIQLAKYNSAGVIQWQRSLAPTIYCTGIVLDSSNNVYISGVGNSYQIQVAKYNSSGTIQWQRSLTPSARNGYAYSIALDSSANVYICGDAYDTSFSSEAIQIVKYDTNGNIQWQRSLQSSFASVIDVGKGVAVDSSGNVYACGYSPPTEFSGEYQAYLIKYDTSGTLQWQRKLHGSGSKDYAYAVAVDSSSNVYVVGETDYLDPFGQSDGLIAKYNSSGTIQWQRTFGNVTGFSYGATRIQAISVDSSANLYICGITSRYSPDTLLIAKYDTSGTIQWQRNMANGTRVRGYGIAVSSSSVYVCGELRESSNNDFIIAKLPNDGSLTGTYTVGASSIVYATTTKVSLTSTLTAGTASLTASTSSLTDAASTATSASTSLTSTVTTL
jgi:uncharacterized delta-60 repeat protein